MELLVRAFSAHLARSAPLLTVRLSPFHAAQTYVLGWRTIYDNEAQAREAAQRKSLVGSGDRSERIRTYNFPQGRVTDHRINLTLYRLQQVMDGDLDELLDALSAEHQARLLAELSEDAA